jgi:hypothetical protein
VLATTDRALQELDDAEHARLRSRWAEAARSDRRAGRAVGRLRTRSWQVGERVDLTERVDLGKRVRRSELGGCGPPTGSGDA